MSAAAAFPNWVLLEPFVFRRDDDESFPDDSKARIRASGTTSWGDPFRVAFYLAEPPVISRLYAQLPGFPDPRKQTPLVILATHRHVALIRVGIQTPALELVQDFFIYSADNPSLLKAIPPCTEPEMDYTRRDGRLPRRRRDEGAPAKRRVMTVGSIPTVYFLRFPLDKFPSTPDRSNFSWLYRGASAIDARRELKFVNVARNDGIGYGALKPGAGFTITCYTLAIGSMVWNKDLLGSKVWNKDCTATSDELWSDNPPERLPRSILMFPQVNIDRPHVVHFLISEFGYVMKKMWVVTIDMNTWNVESFYQYINGREGLGTEDADLIAEKSSFPLPFLPCEFSKFLHLSRKRKDME